MRGIADERKIQLLLGAKSRQRFFGVTAGTDDRYSQSVEILLCVTKLGRFGRSTGSVRFGEEEEHDTAAFVGFEREFAAFICF